MKVCGMRNVENIQQILKSNIDYIGFIFYEKSSRNVKDSQATKFAHLDFGNTKKIGVFVDEKIEIVKDKVEKFKLDGVQLHGDESPDYCSALSKDLLVFKAIAIKSRQDFDAADAYHDKVAMMLFDTKSDKLKGGTGKKFDWSLLESYKGPTPFLLSGGIQPSDIDILKTFMHPYFAGVDLNSGFEISPALKNENLITAFTKAFKANK